MHLSDPKVVSVLEERDLLMLERDLSAVVKHASHPVPLLFSRFNIFPNTIHYCSYIFSVHEYDIGDTITKDG